MSKPQESHSVLLRLENISKSYAGVQVLSQASLEIRKGEVHALLGNNGSGKSTLIKILAGVVRAEAGGLIEINGKKTSTEKHSPKTAKTMGLTFVHQNTPIFPAMSVAENIAIGRGYETRRGKIQWRDQELRALKLQEQFRISGDPDSPVEFLRPADRTLVSIARALQDQSDQGHNVLVLDEPTATLPAPDVDLLLTILRRYASRGHAILFVTHRLDEVRRFGDRATALRDGKVTGTHRVEDLSESELVSLVLGRPLDSLYPEIVPHRRNKTVLELRGFSAWPVQDVTLQLAQGEVLGVAGLIGSGKSELLRALFGAYPVQGGKVLIDGKLIKIQDPTEAVREGLAYVSADRTFESAFGTMSLRSNLSITRLKRYWKPPIFKHKLEAEDGRYVIRDYLISASSEDADFSTLSGGNQQKAVLARWLQLRPKVLMLDEPTQGVAIDARAEIYKLIRAAALEGTSIILVSSDFEELARVSDRVLTINQGHIMSELKRPELNARRLTELAHFYMEGKA